MALTRFGSIVQALSGRVGAYCYARQGATSIVRTAPLPGALNSAANLTARAALVHARGLWNDLSDAEVLTWSNAAKQLTTTNRLGLKRQISGFNCFMQCAISTLMAGGVPSSAAVPPAANIQPGPLEVELWPGGPCNIIHPDWLYLTDFTLTTRAQRCVRTRPTFPGQCWRTISHQIPDYQAVNIWSDLVAALGTPAPLEWLRIRLTTRLTSWPTAHSQEVHVQMPECGDELTQNGDFQTGGTPPSKWSVTGGGSLTQTDYLPWGDGYSGSWVVPATAGAKSAYQGLAHSMTFLAGEPYTVRFAYRSWLGTVTAIYIGGTGMTTQTLATNFASAGLDYERFEASFTPDGTTTAGYLRFYQNASTSVQIDLDNVSIRKDTA